MRDMRLTIMTLGLTQFIFITRCDVIIAIDFDGTCVTHAYPGLGYDIGAIKHLKQLVANGHKLILNTMRSGEFLQEAVDWFAYNDIALWGVNKNPRQSEWTSSPKVYAELYIDDAALGIPLTINSNLSQRPFVNWDQVAYMLHEKGLI